MNNHNSISSTMMNEKQKNHIVYRLFIAFRKKIQRTTVDFIVSLSLHFPLVCYLIHFILLVFSDCISLGIWISFHCKFFLLSVVYLDMFVVCLCLNCTKKNHFNSELWRYCVCFETIQIVSGTKWNRQTYQ